MKLLWEDLHKMFCDPPLEILRIAYLEEGGRKNLIDISSPSMIDSLEEVYPFETWYLELKPHYDKVNKLKQI